MESSSVGTAQTTQSESSVFRVPRKKRIIQDVYSSTEPKASARRLTFIRKRRLSTFRRERRAAIEQQRTQGIRPKPLVTYRRRSTDSLETSKEEESGEPKSPRALLRQLENSDTTEGVNKQDAAPSATMVIDQNKHNGVDDILPLGKAQQTVQPKVSVSLPVPTQQASTSKQAEQDELVKSKACETTTEQTKEIEIEIEEFLPALTQSTTSTLRECSSREVTPMQIEQSHVEELSANEAPMQINTVEQAAVAHQETTSEQVQRPELIETEACEATAEQTTQVESEEFPSALRQSETSNSTDCSSRGATPMQIEQFEMEVASGNEAPKQINSVQQTATVPQELTSTQAKRNEPPNEIQQSKSKRKQPKPTQKHKSVEREIQKLQGTVHLLIPNLPYHRLVREILQQYGRYMVSGTALDALHEMMENYLVQLFEDSQRCAQHANRVTVQPKDMGLVRILRGPSDPGNR